MTKSCDNVWTLVFPLKFPSCTMYVCIVLYLDWNNISVYLDGESVVWIMKTEIHFSSLISYFLPPSACERFNESNQPTCLLIEQYQMKCFIFFLKKKRRIKNKFFSFLENEKIKDLCESIWPKTRYKNKILTLKK